MTRLFYEAGVPREILQLMPGSDSAVGQALIESPKISGVIFIGLDNYYATYPTNTCQSFCPYYAFYCRDFGDQCNVADSTALPEQLVHDFITSAFNSAG